MAKRSRKTQKSQTKLQEYVTVTFTEDIDHAKDCETLLKSNDIPVMVKEQIEEPSNIKGFAVMVPEDFLDEAHIVIESQSAYDDFYDFSSEDTFNEDEEEEDDDSIFDSELLDDDF